MKTRQQIPRYGSIRTLRMSPLKCLLTGNQSGALSVSVSTESLLHSSALFTIVSLTVANVCLP